MGRGPDDDRFVLQRRSDPPDLRRLTSTEPDRRRQRHQERRGAASRSVIAGKHKFGAYLDRIIKFRGHECPALSGRRGVRHPQPEALLHGAGEVHRHADLQAAPRSGLVGERRDLLDQREAVQRAGDRRRPPRSRDDRAVELGHRALLLPRARSPHRSWRRCRT